VKFKSVTESYLDSGNDLVSHILLGVLAHFARLDATKISSRTEAGLARVRAQGKTLGRPDKLEQESLHLYRQIDFEPGQIGCLDAFGVAAFKLGDFDRAETLLHEALAIANKWKLRWLQAYVLSNLAKVATAKGDYAGAERHLARSLRIGLDIKHSFSLAAALVSLAELRIAQGEPLEAAGWLARVAQHPKTEKHDRDEARRALAGLRDRLPPEALEAAGRRAEGLTLEGLASDLLIASLAN
jgi:tetratricopeptide (TPR) repeat protein